MTPAQRARSTKLAFAVCLGAGFISMLDVSIVNVALPSIERSLDAAPSALQWIVSGYTLAFGLVLITAGRLGDTIGRRRLFMGGLTGFIIASTACALVPSAPVLAAVRLAQGFAAGFISPQVIGFIQQLFQGGQRARAFGAFGAMVGIATSVGPLVGGSVIALFGAQEGWRAVFLVNVPIGATLLVLAARFLPADQPPRRRPGLDILGLALLGLAVLAIMLPFIHSPDADTGVGTAPWWLLGVGGALLVGFIAWERYFERRGGSVVMPAGLLKTPSFSFGTAVGLTYFAGFTSVFLLITLFLQDGLGLTPLQAGLAVTPFAIIGGVGSMVSGRLVMRIGRWTVVLGISIMISGLALTGLVARWSAPEHTALAVATTMALAGFGGGLVISPNQALTLSQVPLAYAGTAGATLQTVQRLGTSVGLAVTTGVFFTSLAGSAGNRLDYAHALTAGLAVTIGMTSIALLVAVTDALRRRRTGDIVPGGAPPEQLS